MQDKIFYKPDCLFHVDWDSQKKHLIENRFIHSKSIKIKYFNSVSSGRKVNVVMQHLTVSLSLKTIHPVVWKRSLWLCYKKHIESIRFNISTTVSSPLETQTDFAIHLKQTNLKLTTAKIKSPQTLSSWTVLELSAGFLYLLVEQLISMGNIRKLIYVMQEISSFSRQTTINLPSLIVTCLAQPRSSNLVLFSPKVDCHAWC